MSNLPYDVEKVDPISKVVKIDEEKKRLKEEILERTMEIVDLKKEVKGLKGLLEKTVLEYETAQELNKEEDVVSSSKKLAETYSKYLSFRAELKVKRHQLNGAAANLKSLEQPN